MTTEIACKDAIFHFNKHHLVDPTTPPWTIKTGGKTYYVNHVECNLPWSTKETPDNASTKGAIKIKKALLIINDSNDAELRQLTNGDLSRIRANKRNYARILVSSRKDEIKEYLKKNSISHGKIVPVSGSCGSSFDLIDIKNKSDMVLLSLSFHDCYRILQPNEVYYKVYDDPDLLARLDADDYYDGDNDDDSEE
jgi:hypothetical protein